MKIVLVGDSIRMGYERYVRKELADLAEVWAPAQNGGDSRTVLAHLDEWVLAQQPDLVHLNCGLHDVKREGDASPPAISLAEYEANLRAIFQALRQASLPAIWATTTPVNELWHARTGTLRRREEDVIAYNRASIRVASEFGLPVNDLYCLITGRGRDLYLSQDGRHFVPVGYALLGKAVADAIRPLIIRASTSGTCLSG